MQGPVDYDPQMLRSLKEGSLKVLPESYHNVWLGMTEADLVAARTEAKFLPARSDPDERRWYQEIDRLGVRVWYGIERETRRLVVVQMGNSVPTWRVFREHAAILMERYGTDYEMYTCPAGDPLFKMTRLLWPRPPVAVMEAILEGRGNISITMVVSTLKDARKGIERQKCTRVEKEGALQEWIEQKVKKEDEGRHEVPHKHRPH